jgi:hypothetical protein
MTRAEEKKKKEKKGRGTTYPGKERLLVIFCRNLSIS